MQIAGDMRVEKPSAIQRRLKRMLMCSGFRLRINLDAYYKEGDARRTQAIWLAAEQRAGNVAELEQAVCEAVGIQGDVRLLVGDMLLPREQPARIVRRGDCVTVIPDAVRTPESESLPQPELTLATSKQGTSPPPREITMSQENQALCVSESAEPVEQQCQPMSLSPSSPMPVIDSPSLSEAKKQALLLLEQTVATPVKRRRRTRRRTRPRTPMPSVDPSPLTQVNRHDNLQSTYDATKCHPQAKHIIFDDHDQLTNVAPNNTQSANAAPNDYTRSTNVAPDDYTQSTNVASDTNQQSDYAAVFSNHTTDNHAREQSPTPPTSTQADDSHSLEEAKQRALLLLEQTLATPATRRRRTRRRTHSQMRATTPIINPPMSTDIIPNDHITQSTNIAPNDCKESTDNPAESKYNRLESTDVAFKHTQATQYILPNDMNAFAHNNDTQSTNILPNDHMQLTNVAPCDHTQLKNVAPGDHTQLKNVAHCDHTQLKNITPRDHTQSTLFNPYNPPLLSHPNNDSPRSLKRTQSESRAPRVVHAI